MEYERESEETQARHKILELIGNLEAKHLRMSEENRQMLSEALNGSVDFTCLTQTLHLQNTQNVNMGSTVAFLETLNYMVREDAENECEQVLISMADEKDL